MVVFVIVFISGGHLLGALFASDALTETITFSIGDPVRITEATVRGELYADRAERHLNYSSNTAAVEIADEGGGVNWDNNIPFSYELKQEYEDRIQEEYETRHTVRGCTEPNVQGITKGTTGVHGDSLHPRVAVDLTNPAVMCGGEESSLASVRFVPSPSNSISTENPENRYLKIADYARDLVRAGDDEMPEDTIENTVEVEGECGDSRSEVRSEAQSEAESDADPGNIAQDAYNDVDQVDDTDVDYGTEFGESSSAEILEDETEDCDCETDDDGNEVCHDQIYTAEGTYTADEVILSFDIEDNKYELVTDEPTNPESIEFSFEYVKALTG